MPTCRREREVAALQVFVLDGVPIVGVVVDSTRGVSLGIRKGAVVAVAAFAAGAVGVDVVGGRLVSVGDESGGGVCVGVDKKTAVASIVLDAVGGGSVGIPEVTEAVLAGGTGVDVEIGEFASPVRSRIRKRSNKRIATMNLKKS